MVYDHNMQATHCAESPTWTGRWFSPRGDKWWPVWACPDHSKWADGPAGVRPPALASIFMADKEPKVLSRKQLERAAELIEIMKVARDNRVWPDYSRAEAELQSLLPNASEPLS